jgi:hypothetical protein
VANNNTPWGYSKAEAWPQLTEAVLRLNLGTAPVAVSADEARIAHVATNPPTGAE